MAKRITKNWQLYFFLLPACAYYLIFHYMPMYGVQIAFKNYTVVKGIWGSDWIGFDHFLRFFNSYYFKDLILNTLGISFYMLAVAFPIPIVLALGFNELKNGAFKKLVQTVTYAPHFISMVVMTGIILTFLHPQTGMVNQIITWLGMDSISFISRPEWFKTIYVFSDVWQNAGWGTIIYLAALSGVDPQLHEAAVMDGATRLQRLRHINVPAILPAMIILLIMNVGNMMAIGFEKIYLLQNPLNMSASDVISTYVYRSGLQQAQYSFSSAVGLFNAVINCILLIIVNFIAKRTSETSLW